MATETVTPAIHVSKERTTFCLVKNLKAAEGVDPIQFMTETAAQRAVEAKEGEVVASQSFLKPQVADYEGAQELFGESESEFAKLLNRGIDSKAYQSIRARMLEKDEEDQYVFQAVEGDVDLSEFVATVTSGRATSPEAKLSKVLDGLDADTAMALLAKLQAKLQGGA